MPVLSIAKGSRVATTALSAPVAIPPHDPGDVIRLALTYNDVTNGAGYQHNVPAGFVQVGQTRYSVELGMTVEFARFDDGVGAAAISSVTVSRATGSGTENMTITPEILRGVDRTTPYKLWPVSSGETAAVHYDFGAGVLPAGSYTAVNFGMNSNRSIANDAGGVSTLEPGWSTVPTATFNASNRQLTKASPAAETPGDVGYTSTSYVYYGALAVTYLPTGAPTAKTGGVAAVSGDAALYGAAANIVAALNDTDNTTGFEFAASGDTERITLVPLAVPGVGEGLTLTVPLIRTGGTSGTWTFQLVEGGVARGPAIVKQSTGTSLTVETVQVPASTVALVGAPATFWANGATFDVTAEWS